MAESQGDTTAMSTDEDTAAAAAGPGADTTGCFTVEFVELRN